MRNAWMFASLFLSALSGAGEPVFDVHVHLRDSEKSLLKYEAEAKDAGIELAGVGAMWFGGPNQALAGDPAGIRAGNDSVLALAAKHPEVTPIATVHPYDGQAALDELARVAARGIKMLKIHPHTQRFAIADPRVLALVTKAGELGMVVLMDNAGIVPGDCQDLFNLALNAPKTRFIFAHIGGAEFRFWSVLALTRTADGFAMNNIYFDISATVLLAADSPIEPEFIWTLRKVGIDHVMLGSDYPQITLARTVEAFQKLHLTPEEMAGIRSENARRLLGGNKSMSK
jgi:predicted TIM-barrel fold metal-dependent hydrolase